MMKMVNFMSYIFYHNKKGITVVVLLGGILSQGIGMSRYVNFILKSRYYVLETSHVEGYNPMWYVLIRFLLPIKKLKLKGGLL